MSAKLFNEPQEKKNLPHKTIRKIDDLILDAEKEAQAEIERKIRSKNTRLLLLVLVGASLFYVFINGPQNILDSISTFMAPEPQVAETPPSPGPIPKPIPFPVGQTTPGTESPAEPETTDSEAASQTQDTDPLENEAISMIQKNLGAPEKETSLPLGDKAKTPSTSPSAPSSIPAQAKKPDSTSPAAMTEPGVRRLTPEQSRFFIQVGAFSVKANADRVIKRLMSGGFSPLVQTRLTRTSMYVVFIGGFADEINAGNMISELKKKDLNPALKKNDNGSYSIILGKEKSKAKAEALKENLTRQGIFTSLKQMNIDSRMFIVRVGNFDSNTHALENQRKIEDMGYKGTLIGKNS